MKTRQSKYSFAVAHSEVRAKPYVISKTCIHNKLRSVQKEDCKGVVWLSQLQARALHVAHGTIQKKSSNLKFVEKRVRLHLFHGITCAGSSTFAQEQ